MPQGNIQDRTDEDLACAAQAGSVACFETLVHRYERRLFQFILARVGNTHDAQDLTQNTFVKTYRGIHRYDPAYPFAPWLFTIARRLAAGHYRRAGREVAEVVSEPADTRDPSHILSERERGQALWALARRSLPENQFTALWLRYEEDMAIQGIARTMGKTQTHVKVLLHRARRRLAGAYQSDEGSEARAATDAAPARDVPGTPDLPCVGGAS